MILCVSLPASDRRHPQTKGPQYYKFPSQTCLSMILFFAFPYLAAGSFTNPIFFLAGSIDDELPDRFKDVLDLFVVPLQAFLQLYQLEGQLLVRCHHLPKPHKNPHYGDVNLDRALAICYLPQYSGGMELKICEVN